MTTIYLHIGTPKTGTSSIQKFLRKNDMRLQQQGVIYPDFKVVFPGISPERNGHFMTDKSEKAQEYYNNAVKMLSGMNGKFDKIILSEEELWNNDKRIGQFFSDMSKANCSVKIVVYLRRQDLYLQSQWAQHVKEHMIKEFYTFSKTPKIHLDYYKQLSILKEIAGIENMIVRVYEKQQFTEGNLLADFADAAGFQIEEDFKELDIQRNPSLSGIYLETKRMLNRTKDFATKKSFVVPYLETVAKRRDDIESYSENKYFTYEQQMEFLSQYEKGNRQVAMEFLDREDGILFRDEITMKEKQEKVYSLEEYVDVLAEVILLLNEKVEAQTETIKELKALKKGRIIDVGLIRAVARKLKRTLKG